MKQFAARYWSEGRKTHVGFVVEANSWEHAVEVCKIELIYRGYQDWMKVPKAELQGQIEEASDV